MTLRDLVDRALERRADLVTGLRAEDTDAYRLFHGVAEGRAGLTIDRYGPLVLVQTFREPLEPAELDALEVHLRSRLDFPFEFACRDRSGARGPAADSPEHVCRELGARFLVRARHAGLDPWLFLDLRAGRRAIRDIAPGRSVLNLFAYTCAAGVVAAQAGASEVTNVDFARSALDIGRRNAELNGIDLERMHFIHENCLPILRQLAGLPVKGRASARAYTRVEPRPFGLVILDPPTWAKSAFGAVDIERDYESLFKPAVLCAEAGGLVLATNHSPFIALEPWLEALRRCAAKAGRPLGDVRSIAPEADFPAFDARPPLKIALCEVGGGAR